MGHVDMKQSNQSTNEDTTGRFRNGDAPNQVKNHAALANKTVATKIASSNSEHASALSSGVWSTEGLLSSSSRLYQRSNSTPPTHASILEGRKGSTSFDLSRFALHETVEENNQDEDVVELDRHDLVLPIGKNMQRSWSAPPVPENNFDSLFNKQTTEANTHRMNLLSFDADGMSEFAESNRNAWPLGATGSNKFAEKSSIATVSPIASPVVIDGHNDGKYSNKPDFSTAYAQRRAFEPREKRPSNHLMSLVDRVQEDFPRTPSPVFGCSSGSISTHPPSAIDQSMADAMKQLRMDSSISMHSQHHEGQGPPRVHHRRDTAAGFVPRAQDFRAAHDVQHTQAFLPPYSVVAPPGFQAPSNRAVYGSPMVSDPRVAWTHCDDYPFPGNRFAVTPVDYGMMPQSGRGPFKGGLYAGKHAGGIYSHLETPPRFQGHPQLIGHPPLTYDVQEHHLYNVSQPTPVYRSKSGPTRRGEYSIHPAQSYSSTTLLEEFKTGAKADKWDLRTIQGHLVQFARDQAGSRFIQQKLEKADDRIREEAFNEVFPEAMVLMTDVFGNYVIQKFFDHGSLDQQRRLVGLMKTNMVALALQVYGCRVIQKALEVTEVDEQLLLIRELRGYVMKCVIDQNGNHVLQKCIEAASWKKCMALADGRRHVLGEDIQFIVDDFTGHAAALSTHAYGCRVIQRVLEHCSPQQIRPIVNEIIYKCRDLVKDQFGNYVVQHVICHGEVDQRNIVVQAILPDVAKWSQHKYASNVVEACLDSASKDEIRQIVDLILDCDESGASCALLPMMKHMYGNYVVQKLLDRADRDDRQRIVRIIQHNADYLKRFTYGKHVLTRIERELGVVPFF